jgi:hypothetical protein
MPLRRMLLQIAIVLVALASVGVASAEAQGQGRDRPRQYQITHDRAILVTREVLVRQGYEVIRIEDKGDHHIVHYRAGNNGRGRGKGPPATMIIRKVRNRIVFENTPSAILIDIDIKLKL